MVVVGDGFGFTGSKENLVAIWKAYECEYEPDSGGDYQAEEHSVRAKKGAADDEAQQHQTNCHQYEQHNRISLIGSN